MEQEPQIDSMALDSEACCMRGSEEKTIWIFGWIKSWCEGAS